ncbi:hypothetical protein SATMO3_26190 [Sporomusa aerivorans]
MSNEQEVSCLKPDVNCPCPQTECDNHSQCCKCVTLHRASNSPTCCMAALISK